MITTLTTAQKQQLNQMNRGFSYGAGASTGFSQFIADLLTTLSSGEIGIQSQAFDVDSLCLGGGAFSVNLDITGQTGLSFGYLAGSFLAGGTSIVQVAAGSVTCTASVTNYIEVDAAGAVHASTGGFTAGRLPLYEVVAGTSTLTSWSVAKTILVLPALVTGAILSASAASKQVSKGVGTLTATDSIILRAPVTGNLSGMSLVCPVNVSTGAAYWSVSATNLGAAGSGTAALLSATAVNSTNTTGGSAITANVPFPLTLSGTVGVNADDVILVTFTATGSPSALTGSEVTALFSFTG